MTFNFGRDSQLLKFRESKDNIVNRVQHIYSQRNSPLLAPEEKQTIEILAPHISKSIDSKIEDRTIGLQHIGLTQKPQSKTIYRPEVQREPVIPNMFTQTTKKPIARPDRPVTQGGPPVFERETPEEEEQNEVQRKIQELRQRHPDRFLE